MTTKQKNRLSMFLMMRVTCHELMPLLGTLPRFASLFAEFEETVVKILGVSEEQELNIKGKTRIKQAKKEELIGRTMEIIRRVKAYAEVNDQYELKAEINYSPAVLKKKAATQLRTICQVVHEKISEITGQLNDFGITQTMLDEQQAAIDIYMEHIVLPRLGIIQRKNATGALDTEFKKVTRILKKMDKVAAMTETTNPGDYKRYRNARAVVDLRKRRKDESYRIEGRVVDEEKGMPVSGVHVSVVGTTLVMMTGMDGRFKIPVEGAGDYMLRGERDDYRVLLKGIRLNGEQEEVVLEMGREG